MKVLREFMYKVFVGCCDTYEAEDYAFVGSLEECNAYVVKYNHQKEIYIEPAGYTRGVAIAGLCEGRHEIPDVDDYIFGEIEDLMDFDDLEYRAACWVEEAKKNEVDVVKLYVTGLTPALTSIIKMCGIRHLTLMLMHYDRETNTYSAQYVLYA
jgi:hypothetical protein